MVNNIELALLTRVIDTQNFQALEKAQVSKEFFSTPEAVQLFSFLREIFHNPNSLGQVPQRDFVKYRFPSFYPFETTESVEILANQLKLEKIKIDLLLLAQEISDKAQLDPFEAVAVLKAKAGEISAITEGGQDLSIAGAFGMLQQNYNLVQDTGGILGIPYPWETLNEETQGMQNGQFIVLYGRPKSMKTWIALWMAIHVYLVCRKRVLFYSREMPPKLIAQRVAAGIAKVDYKAFKNGTLPLAIKERTFCILQDLLDDEILTGAQGHHQPFLKIISDRNSTGGKGGGVSWLQAKIREMKPDIVFVDGMYLMRDDRSNSRSVDWKNIAHISQDLKLTASEFDIPVVGVTQANRAAEKSIGEDLTELAYADALGQDSDAVFRVSKKIRINETTKEKQTELLFTAPGLREGEFEGIVLGAKPAISFDFLRKLTPQDSDPKFEEKEKNQSSFARPTRIPIIKPTR